MRPHEAFFLVEDSLDEKLDELYHIDYSESLEHFDLGGLFKSKSKYKGGFKKGKNTKEYNHDYYIHNKDKWKKDKESEETTEMTIDELKKLGLTDEQIEELNLDMDSKGILMVPTEWLEDLATGGLKAIDSFINGLKDTWLSLFKKKDEEENNDDEDLVGPKSPFVEDPKTINDPQNTPIYEMEIEDQSGRTEKIDLGFDYVDYYKDFAIKDKPASVAEDCEAVNPHYKEVTAADYLYSENFNEDDYFGYQMNCGWCSYAYELRRRGYDVQAPRDSDGLYGCDIAQFYEDTTIADFKSPKYGEDRKTNTYRLFNDLSKEGDGARGALLVSWDDGSGGLGGGHCMAWEVIDGKAYVIDAQTNTVMDVDQFYKRDGYRILWDCDKVLQETYGFTLPDDETIMDCMGCTYLRTDNRELSKSDQIVHHDMQFDLEGKIYMEPNSNIVDAGDHIVSYEPSEESKEIWKRINEKTKTGKINSKRKKRRKRDAY